MRMSRHMGVYAANRVYLYKRGNLCSGVSGGWAAKIGTSAPYNRVEFAADHILLSGADYQSNYAAVGMTRQSLSRYRKLCARLKCSNMNRVSLCVYATMPGGTALSGETLAVRPTVNNTETTVEIALTGTTPDAFPAVLANNGGVLETVEVYEIWLER